MPAWSADGGGSISCDATITNAATPSASAPMLWVGPRHQPMSAAADTITPTASTARTRSQTSNADHAVIV